MGSSAHRFGFADFRSQRLASFRKKAGAAVLIAVLWRLSKARNRPAAVLVDALDAGGLEGAAHELLASCARAHGNITETLPILTVEAVRRVRHRSR
jgi:hypothetical protein